MTDLPVIIIRFALYTDLMVLTGLVAFTLYAMRGTERVSGLLEIARPAILLAALGLLLSGIGMAALIAAMTDSNILAIDAGIARSIITESAVGWAWIVRMIAMSAALGFALALKRVRSIATVGLLLASGAGLVTLIWTGHAGATEGWPGTLHCSADAVHMLAGAIWFGALAALSALLFRSRSQASPASIAFTVRALRQFSRVGTIAVSAIVLTGIVNAFAVVGLSVSPQWSVSAYSWVLAAKLALFAMLLALAAINRWRLVPRLSRATEPKDTGTALTALRVSLALELLVAFAILAMVAWLGVLQPAGSPP